jgi:hypothetical protein
MTQKEDVPNKGLEEGLELAKNLEAWLARNPRYYLNKSGRKVRIFSSQEHV